MVGIRLSLAFCICFFAPSSHALPFLIDQSFKEIGNDVQVAFAIKDPVRNAFHNLPLNFGISLLEEDFIFNDFLGSFSLTLIKDMATVISRNGYESHPITYTFTNASDAHTGWGNDYILRLSVPEPGTLLLIGGGLVALLFSKKRALPMPAI